MQLALAGKARPHVVVFAVGFVLDFALLVPMLKAALNLARPMAALGPAAVPLIGEGQARAAFPSGHAAFAVLAAVVRTLQAAFQDRPRR